MPWKLKLSALCVEDSSRLMRFLSGTILACGGWVLSRSCTDADVRIGFEFERSVCEEIYTSLIAAGLELSQDSHQRLTELCLCTRYATGQMRGETVEVELEVLTGAKEQFAARPVEELKFG
jgi:hypothetical protein